MIFMIGANNFVVLFIDIGLSCDLKHDNWKKNYCRSAKVSNHC